MREDLSTRQEMSHAVMGGAQWWQTPSDFWFLAKLDLQEGWSPKCRCFKAPMAGTQPCSCPKVRSCWSFSARGTLSARKLEDPSEPSSCCSAGFSSWSEAPAASSGLLHGCAGVRVEQLTYPRHREQPEQGPVPAGYKSRLRCLGQGSHRPLMLQLVPARTSGRNVRAPCLRQPGWCHPQATGR